jgi:Fe-S oxidoreductase
MSFMQEQRRRALHVAENCIECGRCFQFCQFDIFPKEHMKSFYLIRQANSSVLFNTPISPELKKMLFQCSICDRCYDVCPEHLHRADANLYQKLKLPSPIKQSLNFPSIIPSLRNEITTNVSLSAKSKEERAWIKSLNTFSPAKILVYHGCYANFTKETCMRLENILLKADEDYTSVGGSKFCCGGIDGYRGNNKFRNSYSKLKKAIENINPFEIITSCGHCYDVLNRIIYEMDVDIKVKHAADKIEELISEKKLKLHKIDTSLSIQDSCLMPHLFDDKGPIRSVLKRITSYKEMKSNKNKSQCCGNISLAFDRKLVDEQNKKIIEEHNATETSHIMTYCARCYEVFNDRYKKQLKPIDFIDVVYDSIFNKQRLTESEVVPHPNKRKDDEGLLSIDDGSNKKKTKTKKNQKKEPKVISKITTKKNSIEKVDKLKQKIEQEKNKFHNSVKKSKKLIQKAISTKKKKTNTDSPNKKIKKVKTKSKKR